MHHDVIFSDVSLHCRVLMGLTLAPNESVPTGQHVLRALGSALATRMPGVLEAPIEVGPSRSHGMC